MVHGVGIHTDVDAGREEIAFDVDTAGADFAPGGGADGGRHAEGFVDAGAEIATGGEFGPRVDLGRRGEGSADFGDEVGVAGWVGGEVEE